MAACTAEWTTGTSESPERPAASRPDSPTSAPMAVQAREQALQAAQQAASSLQAAEAAWEDKRSALLAAQLAAELRATDAEDRLGAPPGRQPPAAMPVASIPEETVPRGSAPHPPALAAPGRCPGSRRQAAMFHRLLRQQACQRCG